MTVPRHVVPSAVVAIVLSVGSIACPARDDARSSGARATIDTIADTIRVRTERGSAPRLTLTPEVRIGDDSGDDRYELARVSAIVEGPAGGIYVWDSRRTDLRLFDSTGTFVRAIGRRGEGPGEYQDANGIASVSGGDVAVWDAQSGRFTIFAPDGSVRTSWRWRSSMIFAPHALPTDAEGNLFVPLLIPPANPGAGIDDFRFAYARVRTDGTLIDTLALPAEEPTPMLRAEGGGSSTGAALPFADQRSSVLTPQGTVGVSYPGVYRVDLPRPDGTVLRIERDVDAIPVQDAERRDLAEEITRDMRKVDPTWRWSGPEIPRVKPHINGLRFDRAGRLWVTRAARGEPQAPSSSEPGAPNEWVDPTTYDIFEPDGTLVGELTLPPRTTLQLALRDRIWTVQRDSLDVPTIVRFRVSR